MYFMARTMRIAGQVINLPPTELQKEVSQVAPRKRTRKVADEGGPASDQSSPQS